MCWYLRPALTGAVAGIEVSAAGAVVSATDALVSASGIDRRETRCAGICDRCAGIGERCAGISDRRAGISDRCAGISDLLTRKCRRITPTSRRLKIAGCSPLHSRQERSGCCQGTLPRYIGATQQALGKVGINIPTISKEKNGEKVNRQFWSRHDFARAADRLTERRCKTGCRTSGIIARPSQRPENLRKSRGSSGHLDTYHFR